VVASSTDVGAGVAEEAEEVAEAAADGATPAES
jgi:hypothetical protein